MTFDEWESKTIALAGESPNAYARRAFNAALKLAAGASEGQAAAAWFNKKYGTFHAANEKMSADPSELVALYTRPSAEIAALRERIAGMEKDAERYRWLRQGGDAQQDVFDSVYGTSLDKQVDNAISKEKP